MNTTAEHGRKEYARCAKPTPDTALAWERFQTSAALIQPHPMGYHILFAVLILEAQRQFGARLLRTNMLPDRFGHPFNKHSPRLWCFPKQRVTLNPEVAFSGQRTNFIKRTVLFQRSARRHNGA